ITAGGPTTFCAGGSVKLSANTGGGLSYQWYKGANPIAGQTTSNYTATTAGNYKCRVTKTATGCFKNSNLIVVTVPCKTENNWVKNELLIYPNPATSYFTIDLNITPTNSTVANISLLNILGEEVIRTTGEINNGKLLQEIALKNLAPGLYLVRIKTGENVFERKIIVE
ncbi:MAG TPA: T9SS type A sorting domain-containing protein, partial [Chitinophagales bacterium]|nr:T9SS type A sorting domain-containing protein [Chitinophagales bacterium]